MRYTTLETIEEEIKQIKFLIQEKKENSFFTLLLDEKLIIEKGRENFEEGKCVSKKNLK